MGGHSVLFFYTDINPGGCNNNYQNLNKREMKKILATSILSLLLLTTAFSQRVVGYYPHWKSISDVNNIQWGKITDIVYAFATTDGSGNITIQNSTIFNAVVSGAQTNGVKVHLSIGGAGQSGNFGTVAGNSTNRTNFANNLATIVENNDLDGVDIDWEFPASWESTNFTNLVSAVRSALDGSESTLGKTLELTAAVSPVQYNNDAITASSYTYIDYFNIMAYDDDRGIHGSNHSAYDFAVESITYWSTTKGLSKSKMRLGVPFYGRNSWTDEAYNTLGAADPATAFNSDSYNGYYYNGNTTIQNKSQLVLDEGLDGIMIWELSQDRTDQYSLLTVIDNILEAGTPCENPNLGFKKSLCESPTITLDPDVSQGNPDFTFAWTQDGSSMGLTTETIDVTVAGEYCVTYTHQTGSCPEKEACVDVIDAEAVNTQDGSRCGTGTVDLQILDAGTYKWYDQETNGTQLGIGTSFTTPSISTTTTYWVEKPAVSDTVGKEYPSGMPAWGDGWTPANSDDPGNDNYARLIFDALSDFTIDYVTIYSSTSQTITFTIYNSSGGTVGSTTETVGAGKIRVPINIDVTTGSDYEFGISDGATIWLEDDGMSTDRGYPFTDAGVLSITATDTKWGGVNNWYLGIYDWEVSAGGSCGRVPVTATIESDCTPPVVSFNSPTNGGSQEGLAGVTLSVDATDSDGSVSSVSFNVYQGSNPTPVATYSGTQASNTFTATWIPTEEGSYTIEATATDDDGNQTTESISFTITIVSAISNTIESSIVVYPNPSSDSYFIGSESGQTYDYRVISLDGVTLESGNTEGSIGSELSSGIYILELSNGSQRGVFRIIKE